MLLFNIFKNFARLRVRHFGRIAANEQNQLEKIYTPCDNIQEKKLLRTAISTPVKMNYDLKRFYCDRSNQRRNLPKVLLPPLIDEKVHAMPSFFSSLRSSYNLYIGIKGQLDKDFDMSQFTEGSKHAVTVVSQALACEDYDSLVGLVSDDLINVLRTKISTLSYEQKNLIAVRLNDICGVFPYSIDVVHEGEQDNQRSFVEITMVYYSLKGLSEMAERDDIPLFQLGMMPENQGKIFLCNYIFKRDYTNGNTEPWIITMLNHLMLIPDA